MGVMIPVSMLRAMMTPGGFDGFDTAQFGTGTSVIAKDQLQVIETPISGYDAFDISRTPTESLDVDSDPTNTWTGLNYSVQTPTPFDLTEVVLSDSLIPGNAIRSTFVAQSISAGVELGVALRLTVKQTVTA